MLFIYPEDDVVKHDPPFDLSRFRIDSRDALLLEYIGVDFPVDILNSFTISTKKRVPLSER